MFAVLMLLIGLAFGSVYSTIAEKSFVTSLDFLFSTNLEARLSQNAVGTFCACFASDFIFLFAVFLAGLAPWGIPVLPFLLLFKGFGIGLTAGYLFISHSLKGIGFYLLVLLPGTFLFCMSLVIFSSSAFFISKQMFLHTISRDVREAPLYNSVVRFASCGISCLIMSFLSAILDTVLWVLFAGNFNF